MKRRSFLPSPSWKQPELAKNFINLFFSIKITYKSFPLQSVCIMYGGVDFATWFLRTFPPIFFFLRNRWRVLFFTSLFNPGQDRLARNPCKPALHLLLVAQTAIFQDIFPSEQSCSYLSPANRFVPEEHTPWFERLPPKFVWSYKRPGYVFPWEMFFYFSWMWKAPKNEAFPDRDKVLMFFRVQRVFFCKTSWKLMYILGKSV